MKNLLIGFCAFLLLGLSVNAQGKYFTREGNAKFFSTSPLEDITADNHQVTAVLDTETGRLEFAVLMKSFEFEKALMEEHFNENYVESDKFPKATFKGEILNLAEAVDFGTNGEYEVKVSGDIEIHGVSKPHEAMATLSVTDEGIKGMSVFNVACADHDIKIPSVVSENIAEIIEVTIDIMLLPFE